MRTTLLIMYLILSTTQCNTYDVSTSHYHNALLSYLHASEITTFRIAEKRSTAINSIKGLSGNYSIHYTTYSLRSDNTNIKIEFHEFISDRIPLTDDEARRLTIQHIRPFSKLSPKTLAALDQLPPHWEIRIDSLHLGNYLLFYIIESMEKDSSEAKKILKTIPAIIQTRSIKNSLLETQALQSSLTPSTFTPLENPRVIKFDNGETLSVCTALYTELPIDSIASETRTFTGQYLSSDEAVIYPNNYLFFKSHHTNYFNIFKSIKKAFEIDANGFEWYFNAKVGADDGINSNSRVYVNALILSLFSHKRHLGNILIIDSMTPIN